MQRIMRNVLHKRRLQTMDDVENSLAVGEEQQLKLADVVLILQFFRDSIQV